MYFESNAIQTMEAFLFAYIVIFYKSIYVWKTQIKRISHSPGVFVGIIVIDG